MAWATQWKGAGCSTHSPSLHSGSPPKALQSMGVPTLQPLAGSAPAVPGSQVSVPLQPRLSLQLASLGMCWHESMVSLHESTVQAKASAQFLGVPAKQQCARSRKIEQGLPRTWAQ